MPVKLTAQPDPIAKRMARTAVENIQQAIKNFNALDGDHSSTTELDKSDSRKKSSIKVYRTEESTKKSFGIPKESERLKIINASPLALELAISIVDSVRNATGRDHYSPALMTKNDKIIEIKIEHNDTKELHKPEKILSQLENLCLPTHREKWVDNDEEIFNTYLKHLQSGHRRAIKNSILRVKAKRYLKIREVNNIISKERDDSSSLIKNINSIYRSLSEKRKPEHDDATIKEALKIKIRDAIQEADGNDIETFIETFKSKYNNRRHAKRGYGRFSFDKPNLSISDIATYITDNLSSGDEETPCCSAGFFSRAPKSTATKNALIKALSSTTNSHTVELVAAKAHKSSIM